MKASEYRKQYLRELRKLKKFAKDLSKIVQGFVKATEAAKSFKNEK